jgi:plastocyanin
LPERSSPIRHRVTTATALAGLAAIAPCPHALSQDEGGVTRIVIERFAFQPDAVRVKAGTRVEFVNKDSIPHSVVFEKEGREFSRSQEQMDEGEAFALSLSAAGEVAFYCGLHPGMKGKMTVTE